MHSFIAYLLIFSPIFIWIGCVVFGPGLWRRIAPPSAKYVADTVSDYVRFDGRISWEKVQKIVGRRGADVSGHQGWQLRTPLISACASWEEAIKSHIDGSKDPKKLLQVIQLLLGHGADPDMRDNRGNTAQSTLENIEETCKLGWYKPALSPKVIDLVLHQAIALLGDFGGPIKLKGALAKDHPEEIDKFISEALSTDPQVPPTANDVAQLVDSYVRYDGRTTWDKVERIVGQPGANVSGYRRENWFSTPLMSAYISFQEALDAKIDGSREPKKILHVIRLLLDHGADPRMINNRGETVRTRLESTRQFHSGPFHSGYDPEVLLPILDQAIEMLREGEDMMQVQEDRTALIGSIGGIDETVPAQPRKL